MAKFDLTGDSSLYIMLPHSGKAAALELVEERMTDLAVREMIKQLKAASPQVAEITLPQIKLDMEPNMNILMKKLGLFIFNVYFCLSKFCSAASAFGLCPALYT